MVEGNMRNLFSESDSVKRRPGLVAEAKPLKRFCRRRAAHTRLKPGVNESRMAGRQSFTAFTAFTAKKQSDARPFSISLTPHFSGVFDAAVGGKTVSTVFRRVEGHRK